MFTAGHHRHSVLKSCRKRDDFLSHNGRWDVLEQLLQDLDTCDSLLRIRLTLEAIRTSVDADVVYSCTNSADEVEIVGRQALPPQWCRQFLHRLLAETPGVEGQLLRSSLPQYARAAPSPSSAALVRLSKSQASWIVALSFRPEHCFGLADVKVMSLARRMLLSRRRHVKTCGALRETVDSLVHCVTQLVDLKAPYLRGHSERVARMAARLARQMRLPVETVSDTYFAGLLHDIGTVNLPEAVLAKPGPLTEGERDLIRQCPVAGDRLLARIGPLHRLRRAVRHHHERYDGRGYPDQLAGDDIPLSARILSVAESCDAMLSPRPYRPCMDARRVEAALADGMGRQWDPGVVACFMACKADVYALFAAETAGAPTRECEPFIVAGDASSQRSQPQATVANVCQETVKTEGHGFRPATLETVNGDHAFVADSLREFEFSLRDHC